MDAVDAFIEKHADFATYLREFRKIFLSLNLEEAIKWGMPTYMHSGKNIAGFATFKNHCSIWFFQRGLLKDTNNILTNAQEGKTRAMRQLKFSHGDTFDAKILTEYLLEAIENEKKDLKIKPEKKTLRIPEELQKVLNANPKLNELFNTFTPGKQRVFAEHIATVKREETRKDRLEKIIPMILSGTGLNDKYRNC